MGTLEPIIVGIDPGSIKTGYGVVQKRRDQSFKVLDFGVIRTQSKKPLPERLSIIYSGLTEVLERYRPDFVSIEQTFVQKNVRSALVLGHARGVAVLAATQSGGAVVEYTPTEIKRGVTGSGHAGKDQVQRMVIQLLGLTKAPAEDAADALAASLCHALRRDISLLG